MSRKIHIGRSRIARSTSMVDQNDAYLKDVLLSDISFLDEVARLASCTPDLDSLCRRLREMPNPNLALIFNIAHSAICQAILEMAHAQESPHA